MIADKAGGLQRPPQNSTAQFMAIVFEICFSVLQRTAKGGQGGPLRAKEKLYPTRHFLGSKTTVRFVTNTFWETKTTVRFVTK